MITPEPTEQVYGEMVHYPSDEGRQTRFLRTVITAEDGVGSAGHLGVIEKKCGGAHWPLEYFPERHCGGCGAAL